MKKSFVSLCILVITFSFLFLGTSPVGAEEPEPIKVGVLSAQSGFAAAWGLPVLHVTNIWADEVNAAGGLEVNGVKHKIQIYKADSKFDTSAGASAAEKLVHVDKVRFIHGPTGSHVFLAVAPITTQAKVITFQYPWIKEYASSKYPYNFNAMPTAREHGKPKYQYLRETYPDKKRVVIMGFRDPGTEDVLDVLVDAAKSQGFQVVDVLRYEMRVKDYYPLITKALSKKPDILDLGFANPGIAGAQVKTARDLGFKGVTFQHTMGDLKTITSIAGKAAEGHLYLGGGSDEIVATEKMKKYKAEYIKRYGRWNEGAAMELYVPLMLGKGIQAAGTFKDPDKVVKALEEMSFFSKYVKGSPQVYFTQEADRKAVLVTPMAFVEIKNGEERTVKILKEMQ